MATDQPSTARLEAVVRGRVHGVGFRVFAARTARRLGLVGWVANEPDGSVRCVAEGARSILDAFVAVLAEGPASAWVERVDVSWSPATGGLGEFAIRTGWHSGD